MNNNESTIIAPTFSAWFFCLSEPCFLLLNIWNLHVGPTHSNFGRLRRSLGTHLLVSHPIMAVLGWEDTQCLDNINCSAGILPPAYTGKSSPTSGAALAFIVSLHETTIVVDVKWRFPFLLFCPGLPASTLSEVLLEAAIPGTQELRLQLHLLLSCSLYKWLYYTDNLKIREWEKSIKPKQKKASN